MSVAEVEPVALGRPHRFTLYWAQPDDPSPPGAGDVLVSYSPARRVERRELILQLRRIEDRVVSGHRWARFRGDVVTIAPGTEPADATLIAISRGIPR